MRLVFDVQENPAKKPLSMYSKIVVQNHSYTNPELTVMVDTGATQPVWCGDPDLFEQLFPDAYVAPYKGFTRGFGGEGSIDDVMIIPQFRLSDKYDNVMTYVDLPVVVHRFDDYVDMILSFSMLQHLNFYYVSMKDGILLSKPKLAIESLKNVYGLGRRIVNGSSLNLPSEYQILRDIYILTQ